MPAKQHLRGTSPPLWRWLTWWPSPGRRTGYVQTCPISSFGWLVLCAFFDYQVCVLPRFCSNLCESSYLAPFKWDLLHSGCAGAIRADVVEGPYGPAEQQFDGVEDRFLCQVAPSLKMKSSKVPWINSEHSNIPWNQRSMTPLWVTIFPWMFSTGYGLGEAKAELMWVSEAVFFPKWHLSESMET